MFKVKVMPANNGPVGCIYAIKALIPYPSAAKCHECHRKPCLCPGTTRCCLKIHAHFKAHLDMCILDLIPCQCLFTCIVGFIMELVVRLILIDRRHVIEW